MTVTSEVTVTLWLYLFSSEGSLKKILLVLVLAGTLACNAVLGEPTSTPSVAPTSTQEEEASPLPPASVTAPGTDPASTATQTPSPRGFVEVRLHKRDGSLPEQLAAESQKALALGLMPVVEFDASW